jgi:hypothetical protein
MRFLCLLFPLLLSSCSSADAKNSNLPRLEVTYQNDSTVLVKASWSRPCDSKGCADSYRVVWNNSDVRKTITVQRDSTIYRLPVFPDSSLVTISVTSIRRGILGTSRTSSLYIKNPDSPPPPVDSLRVDTLNIEEALLDSFPLVTQRILRSEFGVGDSTFICALAKNRYTGRVRIVIDPSWINSEVEEVNVKCEILRKGLETERGS